MTGCLATGFVLRSGTTGPVSEDGLAALSTIGPTVRDTV